VRVNDDKNILKRIDLFWLQGQAVKNNFFEEYREDESFVKKLIRSRQNPVPTWKFQNPTVRIV